MIKAVETHYKGYRFRSRLEARWAVFFDHLGLQWEYEPEGFELGGGVRYLPDFKVTSPQGFIYWYEVKPAEKDFDAKVSLFQKHLETVYNNGASGPQAATLLRGEPMEMFFERQHGQKCYLCPRCAGIGLNTPDYQYDYGSVTVYCQWCDFNTPCGSGNPQEHGVLAPSTPHKGFLIVDNADWGRMVKGVNSAAIAARGARFEHGESGAPRG